MDSDRERLQRLRKQVIEVSEDIITIARGQYGGEWLHVGSTLRRLIADLQRDEAEETLHATYAMKEDSK